MRLLDALAMLFINTFGITQPTAAARRRAAWFILLLVTGMLAGVVAVGFVYYTALHGR